MIVAIIQARMGSKRLPNKVLSIIEGKPLLLHVAERLRYSKLIDKIVIATSTSSQDDKVVSFAEKNNIDFNRGSEDDLLDRFYQTAKKFKAEHIVRIWGDCVLIDPLIVDKVIQKYLDEKLDYCSNVRPPSFPRGNDVEIFSFKALETTWNNVTDPFYREYMTDHIFRNPDTFKTGNLKQEEDLSGLNWCVDYKEDLQFARKVIKHFKGKMFYMEDVLEYIRSHPKIDSLNKKLERYADYKDQLKEKGLYSDY